MTETFNKIPHTTPDFTTAAAAKLAELFPEVVADGKINLDTLKTLLDIDVEDARERFGLSWPGKRDAIRAAQTPTTATLQPDHENSVNWDTTQNVFIEGDNLEVLKILQKNYYGQIKMIYIDPPYNTGNDFVYADDYTDSIGNYLEITGQTDSAGKLSTNAEAAGRFHSNWLNMMYPRLKLARNLLTDDGIICVSIDCNEEHHLRLVLNEVFGEHNFVSSVAVYSNPRGRQSAPHVAPSHEIVLIYARSHNAKTYGEPLNAEQLAEYRHFDSQGNRYREIGLRLRGGRATAAESPTLHFPIFVNTVTAEISVSPPTSVTSVWEAVIPAFSDGTAGTWRWSKEKIIKQIDELVARKVKSADGERWDIFQKDFLTDASRRKLKSVWLDKEINYDRSKEDFKSIGMPLIFDYAKPISLTKKILVSMTREDDLILDFFAGSGTTAHAVMQLNAADGGNRRCISVQLPEPTAEKSEARKAGYQTISEITRERIRRAGVKILNEEAEKLDRHKNLDVGFRAYKLVDTNFTKWGVHSGLSAGELVDRISRMVDSANDDARPESLLTELLLKLGFSLSEKIETVNVAGLEIFSVADGLVLAYLSEHTPPTLEQLRALVAHEPERLVILEDAFHGNDELKTNLVQECRIHNIDLWTA